MKKAALILIVITFISKIFGLTRDIILSYYYGTSNISDSYLISQTISGVIMGFVGAGISTAYIPMYSRIKKNYGEDQAIRFTNSLVNILIILSSIIIIIGLIYTSLIVKVFASGFEGETLNLAVKFTRISLIGIFFTVLVPLFIGFLQIKGNYNIPALIGFPMNLIVIISILISPYNIYYLAIGVVVANVAQLLLLVPFVLKKGFRYQPLVYMNDKHIKNMMIIALPVILGVSINQINVLVDRTLASNIVIGGISAINYASKINTLVESIFVVSITAIFYPILSKLAAEGNMKGLKQTLSEAVGSINLIVIPASVIFIMFSTQVVQLLYGRGSFDSEAISLTANALFFYSIGLVAFSIRTVLYHVFYAQQDTVSPMLNASISMALNIILNIILSKYLGIGGLALATSLSAIACTILLFISLRKKIGSFGISNMSISFFKILCASIVMGIIIKIIYSLLIMISSSNIAFVFSLCMGVFFYFGIIYYFKIEGIETIINVIKRKTKKNIS